MASDLIRQDRVSSLARWLEGVPPGRPFMTAPGFRMLFSDITEAEVDAAAVIARSQSLAALRNNGGDYAGWNNRNLLRLFSGGNLRLCANNRKNRKPCDSGAIVR